MSTPLSRPQGTSSNAPYIADAAAEHDPSHGADIDASLAKDGARALQSEEQSRLRGTLSSDATKAQRAVDGRERVSKEAAVAQSQENAKGGHDEAEVQTYGSLGL
ncbi:hypothetical protein PsYK624_079310 [Phanerochaete sordida]|uniref:Uncharacterized protein n=1 Tax=Phanerochaete sordida TaxID=48140 RepID=A0A9P3LE04_9APHY|nr:hypothetical protein PsYK624_079310 [Phanerochaete sordida]